MSKKKRKQSVDDTINWKKTPLDEVQDKTGKIRHKLMQIERGYRMKSIILDVDIDELEQYVYELHQMLPIEDISEYNRRVHEKYKKGS